MAKGVKINVIKKDIKTSRKGKTAENTEKKTSGQLELSKVNELLLSLNNDIASIRDKKDILNIIHPKLKQLFNTEDIFICRLDAANETLNPFLRVAAKHRYKHPQYEKIINYNFPIHDGFIDKILAAGKPLIFDIEDVNKWQKPPRFTKILKAAGIAESLSTPLYQGGELLGILSLWSENKKFFTPHHIDLIQKVADQISIVVTNIASEEAIRQRDKQNEILLSISNEIASIRGKNDLLQIIRDSVKKYVDFDDSYIMRYNKDTKTCKAYIYHVADSRWKNTEFKNQLARDYPLDDDISNPHIPFVFDVEAMLCSGESIVSFIYSVGIKKLVSIKLIQRGRIIGLLVLLSENNQAFKDNDIYLLQRLSYQISIATANIIANEEIQQREYEKSVLLSISNEIAAVRDKNDLFAVINSKVKEMFYIMGFAIALIDEDRKTHSAFILDIEESISSHKDFRRVISQKYSVTDGVFDIVMNSTEPVTFEINKISKQISSPDYVIFWKKAGIKYIVGVPLRVGENNLGCLFFHHASDSVKSIRSDLLKSVCAQLSVAISNILSIENIRKTDAENLLLLSFSNDLVTVRDKAGLRSIIKKYMKDRFQIKEYIITIKNDDPKTYGYFLHDLQTQDPTDEGFKIITGPKMPIEGAMTGAVLRSEVPVIFNLEEVESKYSFPSASFWRSTDAKNIMGMRLRIAEEDIGILWARPDQMNDRILDGVSSQIAIAIANTLANEKIESQLKEISKYKQQLEDEKLYLQEEVSGGYTYSDIIGTGAEMQKVFQLLSQVASANSTVLILGETGTGKELIARAIHNSSQRKNKLMVKVNCASLPPNLIESELFGHEKGSFTGAIEQKIGKFELANHGTLFLDEIGEMPFDLQVKLLRALQEKEIERVGGKTTIKTDVRIIAATNRDLQKEVNEGKFRSDLYYRLNVFPITLPSLRNRKEDIPVLAAHFIEKYARNAGKSINSISQKVMNELTAYTWPGNVRELEHLIERSILLTNGSIIKEIHLPSRGRKELKKTLEESYIKTIEENERDHILDVLNKCNGKIYGQGGAAELLGVPVSTLNSKIKKLTIKKEHVFVSGKQKG
jgi:formate hydrogenlyase transcriptional activator